MKIEPGHTADYDALRASHYLSAPPANPVRYLRARIDGETAGVLVVAMPTLNGAWRSVAWGEPSSRCRRARAHELNRTLRTIARVIVDPRRRGLGIATSLVRAYLCDPDSPRTEAIAAMGAVCPFFARAGMTEVPVPTHAADARLADAMESAGVEPWRLPASIRQNAFLQSELCRWRRNRGAAVKRVQDDRLPFEAARRLLATPRAYIAEAA